MFIGAIEIRREGYIGAMYGKPNPDKPFAAKIEVHGSHTKTEMVLSPELSARIVEIIADEIVRAARATADAMTAEAMTVTALPAPEAA